LDGLLQPGDRLEDLEGDKNQAIITFVIRTGLAQTDPAEAPRLRNCATARLHVFTANQSLRSLLFSGRSIFVHEAPSSEPSTA
jgi:hypothetical protein